MKKRKKKTGRAIMQDLNPKQCNASISKPLTDPMQVGVLLMQPCPNKRKHEINQS